MDIYEERDIEEIHLDEDEGGEAAMSAKRTVRQGTSPYLLPASILIAAAMISGSVVYLVGSRNSGGLPAQGGAPTPNNQAAAPGTIKAVSGRDVILGDAKAPVTVIEYGDYQCPFCGKFYSDTEQKIRDNYVKSGKVKMVFRNLAFLGPESTAAAEAAECAKDQSKFWPYHDALYAAEIVDARENNGNLTRDFLIQLAQNIQLDTNAFTACFDAKKHAGQIGQDNAEAQAAGVNSTPTTFVNGQKMQGALPFAQFQAAIDAALKSR